MPTFVLKKATVRSPGPGLGKRSAAVTNRRKKSKEIKKIYNLPPTHWPRYLPTLFAWRRLEDIHFPTSILRFIHIFPFWHSFQPRFCSAFLWEKMAKFPNRKKNGRWVGGSNIQFIIFLLDFATICRCGGRRSNWWWGILQEINSQKVISSIQIVEWLSSISLLKDASLPHSCYCAVSNNRLVNCVFD